MRRTIFTSVLTALVAVFFTGISSADEAPDTHTLDELIAEGQAFDQQLSNFEDDGDAFRQFLLKRKERVAPLVPIFEQRLAKLEKGTPEYEKVADVAWMLSQDDKYTSGLLFNDRLYDRKRGDFDATGDILSPTVSVYTDMSVRQLHVDLMEMPAADRARVMQHLQGAVRAAEPGPFRDALVEKAAEAHRSLVFGEDLARSVTTYYQRQGKDALMEGLTNLTGGERVELRVQLAERMADGTADEAMQQVRDIVREHFGGPEKYSTRALLDMRWRLSQKLEKIGKDVFHRSGGDLYAQLLAAKNQQAWLRSRLGRVEDRITANGDEDVLVHVDWETWRAEQRKAAFDRFGKGTHDGRDLDILDGRIGDHFREWERKRVWLPWKTVTGPTEGRHFAREAGRIPTARLRAYADFLETQTQSARTDDERQAARRALRITHDLLEARRDANRFAWVDRLIANPASFAAALRTLNHDELGAVNDYLRREAVRTATLLREAGRDPDALERLYWNARRQVTRAYTKRAVTSEQPCDPSGPDAASRLMRDVGNAASRGGS